MPITVVNHLTLDGVLQAPGGQDEDARDGFRHGGWAQAGADPALSAAMGSRMGTSGSGYLLGRRSYEQILEFWNTQDSPFRDALNNAPKFVVSSNSDTRLAWPNSTLIHGIVPAAIRALARDKDLVVMGSGVLIRTLMAHRLVDEFLLMIHPLVLGSGRRLFEHNGNDRTAFRLTECTTTESGVIIAAYRPAE